MERDPCSPYLPANPQLLPLPLTSTLSPPKRPSYLPLRAERGPASAEGSSPPCSPLEPPGAPRFLVFLSSWLLLLWGVSEARLSKLLEKDQEDAVGSPSPCVWGLRIAGEGPLSLLPSSRGGRKRRICRKPGHRDQAPLISLRWGPWAEGYRAPPVCRGLSQAEFPLTLPTAL